MGFESGGRREGRVGARSGGTKLGEGGGRYVLIICTQLLRRLLQDAHEEGEIRREYINR